MLTAFKLCGEIDLDGDNIEYGAEIRDDFDDSDYGGEDGRAHEDDDYDEFASVGSVPM